ncbi:hypothetical protein [Romboutsia sp.]|uniref:hypothetical protein n=1 Tax=Romboutsia sp. TaxID=1965302 RepID=UPI003F32EEFC
MTEIGKSLIEEAKREKTIEIARNLLEVLTIEMIANKTGLTVEEVKSLKDESK